MRKKTVPLIILIPALLSALILPAAAAGAPESGCTVDAASFVSDLRYDGSAVVTEEWTVTFSESGADGFTREIAVSNDNFKHIGGISDLSVSVDGAACSEESSDSLRRGTYSFSRTSGGYRIFWYAPSSSETRTFSLRYVVNGAVKLYNGSAYYYFSVVNDSGSMLCKNVTAQINAPSDCFAEDFEILDSGSLAGEKSDGHIVFSCVNSAGALGAGVKMPMSLFDENALTLIVDDNTAAEVGGASGGAVFIIILAVVIYREVNRKKLFRKRWEKKCRRRPCDEPSAEIQSEALKALSPARILFAVSGKTVSEADYFTVTVLDLVNRGYITAGSDGFTASDKSDRDECGRRLDDNEKRVIDIFSSGEWKKLANKPTKLFDEVQSFNRKVKFIPRFYTFTKNGRMTVRRCFEMKLSAQRFAYIPPEEISDSVFRNKKYSSGDMIISLLREYELSQNEERKKSDVSKYKYNMFMLRDVYRDGKRQSEESAKKEKKKS